MIVVAIIGLLAALAIYGVRRYMTNSKTAEARQALGAISKGARAAFDGEVFEKTDIIPAGDSVKGAGGALCPEAAPIPTAVPAGEKYQSTDADWDDDAGWSCLKFSMSGPQYFQYDYSLDGEKGFNATAKSKLGGADDETLTLTLAGEVQGSTVTIAP
ncbi:MAG TPA: fimbiral protein pilA, partial [Polyangiaceae bacterium]